MNDTTKKTRKPRLKKVVEEVKTIGWETPVIEIIQDSKFNDFFHTEIVRIKNMTPGEGRRMNRDLMKVIKYSEDEIKLHWVDISVKTSSLPSSQRLWIKQLVNNACIKTIEYYQSQKSKI